MPLPAPPNIFLGLLTGGSWNWLTSALTTIYQNQLEILQRLQSMPTNEEFQTALDAATAAAQAEVAALHTEIQQVADLVKQLSTNQAPTQAQLDQLNALTQSLTSATAQAAADDAPAPPAPPTA